jgi:hypothetical protein
VLARLRADPPAELAGQAIDEVVDLAGGWRGLPPGDGLRLAVAGGGGRVVVRPSGTEPKLKAYLEVVAPTRSEAEARLERLAAAVRRLLHGGGEDGQVTTDQPRSDTIVLDFDQLPTEGAVLANLQRSNPRLGDIVTIRVGGTEVTSAVVVEGAAGQAVGLRLTDPLAEE